jgi:Mg-chelatase subunit ChlD
MNNKIIDAITIEKIISQSSLQVVFLLDITGSISTQIEVAKSIIASFSEIERSMIGIHI